MITPGDIGEARHAALHIDKHHFHRARHDGEFLLGEVSGHGNAVPHEYLVRRAADAGQGDPRCAGLFRICLHCGIACGDGQHLRQFRLMAMDDDIDRIFPEHAEVGLAPHGRGSAEEDIRNLCGDTRPAPAVGQGRAEGLEKDIPVIMIHAHMRAVERFDDHPVNAQWCYGLAPPDSLLPDR